MNCRWVALIGSMSVAARLCGLANRKRKHCAQCATDLLGFSRFRGLVVDTRVNVDLMRDVGTGVDGLVRWNGDHFTHEAHTAADPSRQRPLLLIVITVIGVMRVVVASTGTVRTIWFRETGIERVEGIIRGDQEHSSQVMDACADSFSEGFLLMSGHACGCKGLAWASWGNCEREMKNTKNTQPLK